MRAILIELAILLLAVQTAAAQATATAAQRFRPSVFAGATAVETGLNSGRNLSITGGVDIEFPRTRRVTPALEYRGTFAIDKGAVDGQKNQLAGVKLAVRLPVLQPYATLLYGRGALLYVTPLQVPGTPVFYRESSSNALGLGGGVDYRLPGQFGVKLDLQADRYATPVRPSGHIFSMSATIGLIYRLGLGLAR